MRLYSADRPDCNWYRLRYGANHDSGLTSAKSIASIVRMDQHIRSWAA